MIKNQAKMCGSCQKQYKDNEDFFNGTSQWRVCSQKNLWFNCSCGSTLMIPKGKFEWYQPINHLSEKSQSLFNTLGGLPQLPHIPSEVYEIQQSLQNQDIPTSEVAWMIKKDPFLAIEILRVCDNLRSLRGVKSRYTPTLEWAISFLGRRPLGNLILSATIKTFILPTKHFDQRAFWDHALLTGSIAELLSQKLNHEENKDYAYLGGSLCNIGKIVAAICFPTKMDKKSEFMKDPKYQTTSKLAEVRVNLPEHPLLGEIGAAFWGFPIDIIHCVRYHKGVEKIKKPMIPNESLVHLVSLANQLSHWIRLNPHRIDEQRLSEVGAYFDLDRPSLELLVDQIKPQLLPILQFA